MLFDNNKVLLSNSNVLCCFWDVLFLGYAAIDY